jgi:catalase
VRSERFADHYSQARQFLLSQTPVEQAHIVAAFVFELSKCQQPGIRARMVANLRNVDEAFAADVAAGLRLDPIPPAAVPARTPIADLPPSPALSIVQNGPTTFAGRKVGALVTDGTERRSLDALRKAATAEGAMVELIAPEIGGAVLSDGELVPAHQRVDGGPSVLYDAVAILASAEGAARLAAQPAARDFVHDAHAHAKFIGYTQDAQPLLDAAGVADAIDDGYIVLGDRASFAAFVRRCRDVRFWPREIPSTPVPAPPGR